MRSLRRALFGLGAVGTIAGAVPLVLAIANEGGHQRELLAIFGPLTGWAFVGTGIFAWLRRPENNTGALMTAVGFAACLGSLRVATEPWIFITGLVFIVLPYAVLFHLLLAFPSGKLCTVQERALVAVSYLSAIVIHPFQVLFQDTAAMGLPENPLLISSKPDLVSTIADGRAWLGIALITGLLAILFGRWRSTNPSQRNVLTPVLVSGGAVMVLLGVFYVAGLAEWSQDFQDGLEEARVIVLSLVPFAFLAGLLRSRVAGAAAISELVARLGDPGERRSLRDALADALGDPSLELAYWLPEGGEYGQGEYVDAAGHPAVLPAPGSGRVCTPIESGGARMAAIIHDAALPADREFVRAIEAAALLTLENERLDAELRAKVEELQASRARIVESGDAARRRIERDLHDGAQQRLVSLALNLRLLQSKLDRDPESARELQSAQGELELAMEELRELARGIHPSVLSDRGLDAVLEGLAHRAPLPVELDASLDERMPQRVESTAYFVVAEALTNVVKYARATHARVDVRRVDGRVLVEVSDDGVGGADPERGTGLRGLLDRVAALDGRLEVESDPGNGTTVRAAIPCG